jgi:hypothetical protein
MDEITYDDIKREFSPTDLAAYNNLCRSFVEMAEGKTTTQLWDLAQDPSDFRTILDQIHAIRFKYSFLQNCAPFFKVWRPNPQTGVREELTW